MTKEDEFTYLCVDCGYIGTDFREDCVPLGGSGEWTNEFICPECNCSGGQIQG